MALACQGTPAGPRWWRLAALRAGCRVRGFLVGLGGDATRGPVTYGSAFGDLSLPAPLLLGSVSPAAGDWLDRGGGVWAADIALLALPLVGKRNNATDVGDLVARRSS